MTYENDSNGNDGIDCPATWVLWQGGATPTCPTLGGSTDSQMIVGTHATFNGTTDAIGNTLLDAGTSANNGGVAYTESTVSAWIYPTASSASAGNPISTVGCGGYWILNNQLSNYYP